MDNSGAWIQSITTFIVGLFAFVLYVLGKRSTKRDAAKVIEIEINNAEKTLAEIKKSLSESGGVNIGTKVCLPTRSWEKYKHMFVSDFSESDWNRLSEFYENCSYVDEAINLNNSFFIQNSQAIRTEKYRAAAAFTTDAIQSVEKGGYSVAKSDGTVEIAPDASERVQNLVANKMSAFNQIVFDAVEKSGGHYNPDKPINDTNKLMNYMEIKILDGELGIKLRKIANSRI